MIQIIWISLLLLRALFVLGSSTDSFYFTHSPHNQDVEDGQPLRLECAVKPNDDIHYSWLHNGSMIKPESESGRRFLEGDSNLQILHADRDTDPGRYQCQALNKTSKFVSASREVTINVYWMDPEVSVRLVKPSRIEDIKIGGEVELNCAVRSNPVATMNNILWFHNGNSRLLNMQSLKNGNLHISSFGMQHVGSFHCRVIHPAGKVDSRPPFLVEMSADEPPVISTRQKNDDFLHYAIIDRPLMLTCPELPMPKDADDEMPAIAVWGFMKKLGEQQQPISSLPAVHLQSEDKVLVIDRFKTIHANFYTCEVSSRASDRYTYVFQVYQAALYAPKPFNFSPRPKKNQALAVRLHDTLTLRYYADLTPSVSYTVENISNPPPRIEWFRLGSGGQEPIRILPEHKSGGNSRVFILGGRHLVIRDGTEHESGAYELVLTNNAGRVSFNFRIMVAFPPEFEPPIEALNSQTLDGGQELILSCRIRRRAIPGSRIYWEKDGRALVNYGNDIILVGEGERLQFPRITVDHQGLYQCFVITDGYPKKFPGQQQKVEVRGRLEFVRKMDEHFLEMNVQGRLTCKVRGYGDLTVDWFKKKENGQLDAIQSPNQVENGILIFQYVQKQDAGDYVCIARSSYRDSQINMTVKVIVGEKPRILDISTNQTISEGDRLVLNCKASGDPRPQISWFVKKPNSKFPAVYTPNISGRDMLQMAFDTSYQNQDSGINLATQPVDSRIQVLTNGSLVISQVLLVDDAEYICIAGNKHAIQTRQGVHVQVLTSDEYAKLQLGDESLSPSMLKTIVIVVNCAIAYLGLIFGLTVWCSVRHLKNRRNRNQAGNAQESGHLTCAKKKSPENNCALLLNEEMMNAGSRATTGSPNGTSGTDVAGFKNYSGNQSKAYYIDGIPNQFSTSDGPSTLGSRPMVPIGYPSSNDMSMVTNPMQQQGIGNGKQGLGISGYTNNCSGISMASTTTGDSTRLVSAPPPTPLDSRSHFSGLSSSGNSVSPYSRSVMSGASNSTGPPFSSSPQNAPFGLQGGHSQYAQPNPGEMMTYNHLD